MNHDPLFRAILERLDEDLNDKLFELFAVDVVRQEFPSAVPVLGGSDAGLDGAVGRVDAPRVPIIATTSDRVRDNVRRNLLTYQLEWKALGGGVVVATSARLTPRRQKAVNDLVVQLGFHMVQLYERQAVAERLYHAPRWRLELLGLPGDPPALTQLPPRVIAPPLIPLVGRDEDLTWLEETRGDRLLLAPPAAGKTTVLEGFSQNHKAFFVTTANAGQIADEVRQLEPHALIVDDAHARPEVLDELIRMRSSTGARFDIIATAWSGFHDDVRRRLELPASQLRELRLLQRTEIAQVIRAIGVTGPNWLVKSVLDQADGRVGLAVSLARLCLVGDVKEVVTGDALLRFVRSLDAVAGESLAGSLAPFSVGGRDGLVMEQVAQALGQSILDLRAELARIGSTGFIRSQTSHGGRRTIVVEPPALREALVRAVFFDEVPTLDIDPFASLAEWPCGVARTLVGARRQGGRVPARLLQEWLERCNDTEAWQEYAYLGSPEASWVLDRHPAFVVDLHNSLLARIPERAVPALLDTAIGDQRELHSSPDHGLRILHDWVKEGRPGSGEGVIRRVTLIEQTLMWAGHEESRSELAQHALMLALDPDFLDRTLDPITENAVTLRWSILAKDELVSLLASWGCILAFLRSQQNVQWNRLIEHVQRWIYLGDPLGAPDQVIETLRPHVQRMLADVVSLAWEHAGVLIELRRHAILRGYQVPEPEDRIFRVLFPVLDEPLTRDGEQMLVGRALSLAVRWARGKPEAALAEMQRCIHEAEIAGISWPDLTTNVLRSIAEKAANPLDWLDAAGCVGIAPGREQVLLVEVVRRRPEGWRERLDALLGDSVRGIAAGAVAICFEDLPGEVLDRALTRLADQSHLVQTMWLRSEIPLANQRRILASPHRKLAADAAVAEWWCNRGRPLTDLTEVWSQAVLLIEPEEYQVGEILAAHPELALPWLKCHVAEDGRYMPQQARVAVVGALRITQSSLWPDLLEPLEARTDMGSLVRDLVDGDASRYTALLAEPRLRAYHLAPLAGRPGEGWAALVRLALESGHPEEAIARAVAFGGIMTHWGPESSYWAGFLEALPGGAAWPQNVLPVVSFCRELVEAERKRAVARERLEAVHGEDS